MGTYFDDEGLHWQPLFGIEMPYWLPWVEWSHGCRKITSSWYTVGTYYRLAPKVIEEAEDTDGSVMQTVQFRDGREQVRVAPWRR